jgi:hypothetical protein
LQNFNVFYNSLVQRFLQHKVFYHSPKAYFILADFNAMAPVLVWLSISQRTQSWILPGFLLIAKRRKGAKFFFSVLLLVV